jgi:hypothetical protein
MTLFTTSNVGIAVLNTAAGKRCSTEQSLFRNKLIEKYAARKPSWGGYVLFNWV